MRCAPILLFALAGSAAAAGKPPRAERSAVEARLRAYQPGSSPASLQALGSGVDEVLVAIGRDAKVETLVRARATSALGYFPTALARRYLEDTVDDKAASKDAGDTLLVRKAAVALGWMGGLDVTEHLAPLLDHADPEVRIDAAIGLGLTRLAAAAEPLRKRLDVESEDRVRVQIGRQLRVVEDANAPPAPPKRGAP